MPHSRHPETYYYSSGEKVGLVPDERLVAVGAAAASRLGAAGQKVTDDLVLVDASDLPESKAGRLDELRDSGKALDVFDAAGARVVVLPEIRVETDRPADAKRIADWLAAQDPGLDVQSRDEGILVARLKSGGSRAALDLANRVWEKFHPAASHPRFVRIVPRPGTTRQA